MKDKIANAIRWWEPRRILYNALLTTLVLMRFYQGYPASRAVLQLNSLLLLFGLAVLANVSYCAAYLPDLFVQLAGYKAELPKVRWAVFGIGMAFALVLTYFWSAALLG